VLIYNAVAASRGPLSTLAADTLLADLTVSAAGALVAVQAVLPAMRERGKGTIVFTGGGAAVTPLPNTTLSIGKAALRMLALGLAQELEGSGLRVGTVTIYGGVAPGTPFDPDRIAEAYWAIHTGSAGSDGAEVSFRGANA
jgi:NADP-dependent 3-hydroxy acid dehydrogenase YdfG